MATMKGRKKGVCLGSIFLFANIISSKKVFCMSKVVAPLQSFSASGKVGKSLVFFSHLGRNVVRGLVTPANPQTGTQGDSRLLLGALGRATRAVVNPSDYLTDVKFVTPAGQTWVSYFIRSMIQFYGGGATGVAALQAAFDGHTKDAVFQSQAVALGLTPVVISYAEEQTTIAAGVQLYALAVHAMNIKASNPSLFNRAPYTTALASWTSANIVAFKDDITSEA